MNMTCEQMIAKMQEDIAVRAEYERLNRDELVMLDVIAEERAKDRLPSLSKARMVELDGL